jgi:hypothetical protein
LERQSNLKCCCDAVCGVDRRRGPQEPGHRFPAFELTGSSTVTIIVSEEKKVLVEGFDAKE